MAQEIEITIHQADLGRADTEFGINDDDLKLFDSAGEISVDVFIDGEPAELEEGLHKSVIAKAPCFKYSDASFRGAPLSGHATNPSCSRRFFRELINDFKTIRIEFALIF